MCWTRHASFACVATIKPTQRRRARRARATARREIYLAKRRFIRLTPARLQHHLQRLAAHHSFDPEEHKAILQSKVIMATLTQESWRCTRCKQVQRKGANFCQRCGADWENFYDYDFQPQNKDTQQPRHVNYQGDAWNQQVTWNSWKQWEQRPQSPRGPRRPSRPSSQNREQKGQQKGQTAKGKGKGKHKQKGKQEPAWKKPVTPTPTLPAQPSTPSAPSHEQTLLKSLLGALKKNVDTLPTEVQSIMQNANIRTTQLSTEQMVGQVKQAGKAKEQLQEAYAARQMLHSAWKDFLLEAAQRWTSFAEDFTKEDAEIAQRIEQAKEHFRQARQQLSTSKAAAGMPEEVTQIDTSDDDLAEPGDKEVKQGLANMSTTLQSLEKAATAMVEADQRDEKRRRKAAQREADKAAESEAADASMQASPHLGGAAVT